MLVAGLDHPRCARVVRALGEGLLVPRTGCGGISGKYERLVGHRGYRYIYGRDISGLAGG